MKFYKNSLMPHYICSNFVIMTTIKDSKLKKLLQEHVPGTVLLALWLWENGFFTQINKNLTDNDLRNLSSQVKSLNYVNHYL
jgi:hypothetical protein